MGEFELRHKCNKEVEIAEMHKDIKYIRKALEGNGVPGLLEHVEKNTQHRISNEAKGSMIKFLVGSGWLVTIIIYITSIIK